MVDESPVILIVSAASGTGKSSLSRALAQRCEDTIVSVSHTTRDRRSGEIDGKDCYFVSQDRFAQMIGDDQFAEHACVYGHYYGTSIETIRASIDAGVNVVLDIDWQGAMQVSKKFSEAVLVFLLPPSLQTLKQRLVRRGRDKGSVIEQRFAAAREDLAQCVRFDHLVLNDDFELAFEELRGLVLSRKASIRPIPASILDDLGIAG
ncbi:MAG: guanylate kinase [Acidiferrobacterales bacterium]|nr:guanylate kinase [Acidiferrobacterales bacterium]